MIDLHIEWPRDLFNLDGWAERVERALAAIQADFITQLQKESPRFTGTMQDAWKAGVRRVNMSEAVATVVNVQEYASYVIYGTRPAYANPGGFIVPWVVKKLPVPVQYRIARKSGMSEETARAAASRPSKRFPEASTLAVSVAYAIGRSRMRKGSKGNDFVSPIIEKNARLWEQILADYAAGMFR